MMNDTEQTEPAADMPAASPAAPAAPAPWTFFNAWRSVYRARFCCFKGRAGRKEYWYAFPTLVALDLLLRMGNKLAFLGYDAFFEQSWGVGIVLGWCILGLLVSVLVLIPWMALTARRLHDIGLSGWFALVFFIPWVGYLFILLCGLIPSAEPNKWGNGPEGPAVR